MAIGYFIGEGDKTSCGGRVLEGEKGMMFGNVRRAAPALRPLECPVPARSWEE